MEKILNKEKTIKLIMDKCNKGNGISIDVHKFNEMLKQGDAEEFIVDACIFCEIEPIYDKVY